MSYDSIPGSQGYMEAKYPALHSHRWSHCVMQGARISIADSTWPVMYHSTSSGSPRPRGRHAHCRCTEGLLAEVARGQGHSVDCTDSWAPSLPPYAPPPPSPFLQQPSSGRGCGQRQPSVVWWGGRGEASMLDGTGFGCCPHPRVRRALQCARLVRRMVPALAQRR